MKRTPQKVVLLFSVVLALGIMLSGCSGEGDSGSSTQGNDSHGSNNVGTQYSDSSGKDSHEDNGAVGTRDNTSVVLVPVASGTTTFSCDTAIIDVSNASEGYIMASYTGNNQKVKLQMKGPDGVTYTYDLHGGYEVFPLTAGDGNYTIGVYENISGTKYSIAISTDVNVAIANPFGPYLYPNQYVNFNASSLPVAKAAELALGADTDLEVVERVYNYIIENFTYDYPKAASVVSGYLPVVDDIYVSNTGICFDYAAVMATMLRSQNIPTRLEVGYMGEEYHAWISTYIEDIGWINGVIEFNGTTWNLMDPTFASTSKSPKKFISDNDRYTIKYVY